MNPVDEIKRITINIELSVLEQLQEDADVHKIPRAPYAGIIIKNHYYVDVTTQIQDISDITLLTAENERLKSEIVELKKDKTWYQGELSQLHTGLVMQLALPKKLFKWPWKNKCNIVKNIRIILYTCNVTTGKKRKVSVHFF
jgi:hypothetical protein